MLLSYVPIGLNAAAGSCAQSSLKDVHFAPVYALKSLCWHSEGKRVKVQLTAIIYNRTRSLAWQIKS